MWKRVVVTTGLAAALAGAARAQEQTTPSTPPVFEDVRQCRSIADATERLACYDRTIAALETARESREVVIVDRATIRQTRDGLFGISLPNLKLLDGDEDADAVREITSSLKAIGTANDGLPIYLLQQGGKWKQTDGRNVYPKVGQSITIRRGALNKYTASINGRAGVRVIRILD